MRRVGNGWDGKRIGTQEGCELVIPGETVKSDWGDRNDGSGVGPCS